MYQKKLVWLLCASMLSSQPAFAEKAAKAETTTTLPTAPATVPEHKPSGLTLDEAIAKALASSPRLKSARAGTLASESEHRQAGALPNPELGVQAENFSGSGRYGGFDGSEATLGVSQVIELGSKRSRRMAVAEQEVAISRLRQAAERLDLIRDTAGAYANAVAAQEMLKLAAEQKDMASDLFKEVRERVDAAREPLIQKSKAEITVSTANFAHERAERELGHAKDVLSNLWTGHGDDFQLEEQDFFTLTPPMSEVEVEAKMEQNPALQRYFVNHSRMQAKYELEKAQAIPDPRVNVGMRDFRDSGDRALVAGVSIPIPVFNSNRGSIERARHDIIKAENDAQAARHLMIGEVHESLEMQVNAYRQSETLKTAILPAAEKAFALSRQGYRVGKFPYLEVLDAQRTLFEVKEQYIATLKEYHIAKAEVERITVYHASRIQNEREHNGE